MNKITPRIWWLVCHIFLWTSLAFHQGTAQTTNFTNPAGGNWFTVVNWSNGIPTPTGTAVFVYYNSTGLVPIVQFDSGVGNYGALNIGVVSGAKGALLISGGTLTGNGNVTINGALIGGLGSNIKITGGLWTNSGNVFTQSGGQLLVDGGTATIAQGIFNTTVIMSGGILAVPTINASFISTGGTLKATGNNQELVTGFYALGSSVSGADTTIDTNFRSNSINIDIDGFADLGLIITGGGQLILGGNNTYTGNTTVNSGTLTLTGGLASRNVMINSGGIFNGTGTLSGNLTNSGLVRPGNSVGTLTVNGNYTQTSSGTLAIQVADSTTASQLAVSGAADLDGTLIVETLSGFSFGFDLEGAIPILTADGGVNGTFSTVELPSDFPFELVYNPNDVQLLFSLEDAVMTETGLEILEDILAGVPIGEELDAEQANLLLAEANLVPLPDIALKDILFNATNTQYNQITTRLAALRSGVNTVTLQGLPQEPTMVEQYSKRCGKKQIMTCEEEPLRWDIFANASGIFSVMKTVGDLPKIRSTAGYFSAGADRRINQYFNVGIYVGYQGIRNWNNEDIWFRSNGVKWGLYGTAHWEGFYLNAIVGGGANFTNYNRAFHLMGKHHIARSNPFCGELDSLLGGGYEYRWGSWIFGANNSIQYTYLGINSSTESGAGHNLNAKLYRRNWSSLVYTLGGNISYLWEIAPNYQILPTIGLSWQHEFLNYGKRVHGAFANGAGAPFFINAPGGARNNAFGVAGITAQIGPRIGAYAYYTPQFGGGRIYSNAVLAGVNFNF